MEAKKSRTSASKVRTGCITCKIRHVKCDEEKPACRRCSTTGRKCDGYEGPRPTRQAMKNIVTVYVAPFAVPRKLLPLQGYNEIDEYHRFVAPKLAGYFDSEFWKKLIPQMSLSEPSIQHAVAAISEYHRSMESTAFPSLTNTAQQSRLALKESNEAMRSLSSRIAKDPNSNLVPLVACLLFTCMEFLKGSNENAMMHMANGFNILNAVRAQYRVDGDNSNGPLSSDHEDIERHIVPVFQRLNLLCLLFGRVIPFHALKPLEISIPAYTCMDDARKRLYEITNTVVRFIRISASKADTGAVSFDDIIERVKLERMMKHWFLCLEQYIFKEAKAGNEVDEPGANLLRIHWRTIFIWLSVCLSVEETALDLHFPDFKEIVRLAGILIDQSDPASKNHGSETRQFSFEMGLIPPLYYTTIKCRNPSIRRQSLALMGRVPRREGMWSAHIAAKVAQQVIMVEESGKKSYELMPTEDSRLHGVDIFGAQLKPEGEALVPDESLRIHSVTDPPMEFKRIHDVIIPNDRTPDKVLVTFRSKPWGLGSEWHTWKDYVYL
ncbi:hypothetical protein NA57DRAFT_48940 [Rhizodiscina lignyota]|uniref:Zn(2)-C6 fungal-type domain-containing protein n=1 Tax=Rhizodiscina lignyota TaxID=1504668 RepID=A0A9P4M186_9PEZI|nr:hypothetical protein NA57DRAFT_48940 [Rhizodiscina lignyota]